MWLQQVLDQHARPAHQKKRVNGALIGVLVPLRRRRAGQPAATAAERRRHADVLQLVVGLAARQRCRLVVGGLAQPRQRQRLTYLYQWLYSGRMRKWWQAGISYVVIYSIQMTKVFRLTCNKTIQTPK